MRLVARTRTSTCPGPGLGRSRSTSASVSTPFPRRSHALAQGGHAATRLETSCVVEFGPKKGGGFEVRSSALEVRGTVPGIDEAAFQKAAEGAKDGCPVSAALRIPMSVKATLQR